MITRLMFDWAQRAPGKPAVICNGGVWSYGAFATLIATARGYFDRRQCVGAGIAIVAVHNLVDVWILCLALRSLGLTTIAVPSTEAVAELGLPDVRCVVTTPHESWPGLEAVCASQGWRRFEASLTGEPSLPLDRRSEPPGGHILRTSGTTGDYKMVLFEPAFELASLAFRRALNDLDQDSVFLMFDFPAWTGPGYKSVVGTWSAGGAVVFQQGQDLHEALRQPGLTHAVLVPNMLARILAAPPEAYPRSERLRLSIVGGATTAAQIAQAKARVTPHINIQVATTETTVFAFTAQEAPEDSRWHRPVPGCPVEIVDEQDRPVPVGDIGRLRIGTAGGPCAYLHDAAATQAFFRNGFFYPGDLAQRRDDGRIALQGRVSEVINVGGHKVLPGPVEERLRETLGVTGVCIVALPGDGGDDIYVVVEASRLDLDRLGAAVREEFGLFPRTTIATVAALPRNRMGKVMRADVRAHFAAVAAAGAKT